MKKSFLFVFCLLYFYLAFMKTRFLHVGKIYSVGFCRNFKAYFVGFLIIFSLQTCSLLLSAAQIFFHFALFIERRG